MARKWHKKQQEASIDNIIYNDLEIGQSVTRKRIVSAEDIVQSAELFQDRNPAHLCDEFASKSMFGARIAHGMLSAGLISGVIGEELPGPGTIYLSQNLEFKAPVKIGDEISITVRVADKKDGKREGTGKATLETICTNQDGVVVTQGSAIVLPPSEKISHEPAVVWGDPQC